MKGLLVGVMWAFVFSGILLTVLGVGGKLGLIR